MTVYFFNIFFHSLLYLSFSLHNGSLKSSTITGWSINHFKDSFGLAGRRTQNEQTLHADLLLAGITQLIGVLLADKIHQHQYIRSLKPPSVRPFGDAEYYLSDKSIYRILGEMKK